MSCSRGAMIVVMAGFAISAWLRSGPVLWQRLPLGLYAGWLTAATGVALSAVLTGYGLLPARTAALLEKTRPVPGTVLVNR